MTETHKKLLARFGEPRLIFAASMATQTAFRAGGKAECFLAVDSVDELVDAVKIAKEGNMPVTVIGSGTNALVSSKGIRGLVIKNNCRHFSISGVQGKIKQQSLSATSSLVTAEAGALTNQLVRYTIDEGLGGLESALGLPGTIGGAVAVNAYYPKRDISISQNLVAVRILTQDGTIEEVDKDFFAFGMFHSAIKESHAIILDVTFSLQQSHSDFLRERGEEALAYRVETQPQGHAAGYTFRNMPVHTVDKLKETLPGIETHAGTVSLFTDNPRYILNSGQGGAEDVARLFKDLKPLLKSENDSVQLDVHLGIIGEL